MGLNRRFLSEDLIRKAAVSSPHGFKSFEKFMTGSEVYIIQGDSKQWTSEIFHRFKNSNLEGRIEIYNHLLNKSL